MMTLAGCMNTTVQGGETKKEACYHLGRALPTRSHSDTKQTQDEIQRLYARYALVCPEWAKLIP